ncbi:collagen-binding domain-containing protein [Anaerocolumna xylanovorans]|nr:collagen-binding domain-containing protein [Anaerocolumna xylanovorans]
MERKSRIIILILAVLFSLLNDAAHSTSVQAGSVINYGGFADYNAVILGNHSATSADVEGRIAVRGNSETGIDNGFSYAASYSGYATVLMGNILNKTDSASLAIPSVLVGGKVILNPAKITIIEGGDLVTWNNPGHSDLSKISLSGEIKLEDQSEVLSNIDRLAGEAQSIMDGFQKYYLLNNGETTVYYNDAYSNMDFYKSGLDNHVIVSKNTGKSTFAVRDVSLPVIASDETIVIYSDAKAVNFSTGALIYNGSVVNTGAPQDSTMKHLSTRIVWIFPEATQINNAGYGIIGSVFAPKAEVTTQGGSINGQLYADTLHQIGGFELHNFIYNQEASKPSATTTPSPAASATPSAAATTTPSPAATTTPSPAASATPSAAATTTPSPAASATPSAAATTTPSPAASATPSAAATTTPSPTATVAPTVTPSAAPTPTSAVPLETNPVPKATPSPATAVTPTPADSLAEITSTETPADPELTEITGNKLPKGNGTPEIPKETNTNTDTADKKAIPKTGEESRLPVYITGILFVLSGIRIFNYRKHYSKMK